MSALETQFVEVGNPLCETYSGSLLSKGRERGYEFGLFMSFCSTTPAAKNEVYLTKVILGNDSTYFAIKSWRSELDMAEVANWTQFMKRVWVCDSRIAERACP